jgi:hypothetical protein
MGDGRWTMDDGRWTRALNSSPPSTRKYNVVAMLPASPAIRLLPTLGVLVPARRVGRCCCLCRSVGTVQDRTAGQPYQLLYCTVLS